MRKLIILLFLAVAFGACNEQTTENPTAETDKKEDNKVDAPAPKQEKTIQLKEFDEMSSEEAIAFFGLDLEKKVSYKGSYECYMKDGKEVLHGKMKIQSRETLDEFVKKNAGSGSDEDVFYAGQMYVATKYSGNYEDGLKNGKFIQSATYHESEGSFSITFEADKCTNATYKGSGEGYCFAYDGPLENCLFSEISKKTEEVACE